MKRGLFGAFFIVLLASFVFALPPWYQFHQAVTHYQEFVTGFASWFGLFIQGGKNNLQSEGMENGITLFDLVDLDALLHIDRTDFHENFESPWVINTCSRTRTVYIDGTHWIGTLESLEPQEVYFRWKVHLLFPALDGSAFKGIVFIRNTGGTGDEEGGLLDDYIDLACDGYGMVFIENAPEIPYFSVPEQLALRGMGQVSHTARQAIESMTEPLGIPELRRELTVALAENYLRVGTYATYIVDDDYGADAAASLQIVYGGGSKYGETTWQATVLDPRAAGGRPSGAMTVDLAGDHGWIHRWVHDRSNYVPDEIPFQEIQRFVLDYLHPHRDDVPGFVTTFNMYQYLPSLAPKKIVTMVGTADQINPFGGEENGLLQLRSWRAVCLAGSN